MTLTLSVEYRNARLNAIEAATGGSPRLKLRTGPAPANCAAADTGTVLADYVLPSDWMQDASNGSKAMAGTWGGAASDIGTVGHFRLYAADGVTCHIQGSVSLPGGGGDLQLSSVTFIAGQSVNVTSFTLNDPNG